MKRLAAIVLLVFGATCAHANLITNGSFETPVLASDFQVIGMGGEPAGFGWSVFLGDVDVDRSNLLGTNIVAQDGNQWLDLNGSTRGFIEQFFPTTAGVTYVASFYFADNPFNNESGPQQGVLKSGNMTIRNGANFAELLTSQMFSHSTTTGADADWIYSGDIVFTAVSDLTRIAFSGDGASGSTGPFIDNVVVRVPEPASVALLVLALSLAAAFTRRRARATNGR